ncbi:amino acid ABC transporter permease [Desulfofustis glycolicus]|uniref:General L-amino acid transport system permease protein n=1 Tax=Desulfofustis glycolicus DSM 9705 TaxID=1121409 RepID=A0A1M5VES9_9BACT|nr:amino acid ABC transporter permease [Desulfofustis glycolicus]MCB2217529.1 amino acid ABC transporter permease [Desulfobulbaceae bacterium]SHH73675.1 general L-amino acid transport system permease protein [Desulfofustis glycolicus DSM 9705]
MKSTTAAPHREEIKPPVTEIGVIGWIRANLFNGWFNSLLTLAVLYLLWLIVPGTVKWAFIDSVWLTGSEECRATDGACWSVISANIRFILFGFYPHDLQWRPLLAMGLLVALLFYSRERSRWNKMLAWSWLVGLFVMGLLLKGGLFGLTAVESANWGGLPLTLLLSVFGLTAAYPVGVVLALGRQSEMPVIKSFCVVYIELIRGVPLISLLFMSSVVFPLFLPEGVTVNKILRAQVAIILFTAAYIAEVVRGGLQGIDRGQYEAAESLGLNYFQTMRLIILPQALKIVIPPSVSILISAFKDTSLVVIIALYDLLKTTQTTLSDPKWMGYSAEAYIFVALIYFICCFAMSNYSRKLEKELDTDR